MGVQEGLASCDRQSVEMKRSAIGSTFKKSAMVHIQNVYCHFTDALF